MYLFYNHHYYYYIVFLFIYLLTQNILYSIGPTPDWREAPLGVKGEPLATTSLNDPERSVGAHLVERSETVRLVYY